MRGRAWVRTTAVLLAAAMASGCDLTAQSPSVARGREALRTGRYAEAVRLLEAASGSVSDVEAASAARELARAHAATGDYEEALAALDRAAGSVPPAELARVRGTVLRQLGRDDEALRSFEAAIEGDATDRIQARLDRAVLLWERGDREAAYGELDGFIDLYNSGEARTAGDLTAVGTAVRYLGRRDPALFHDAVRAYEEAIAADPSAHEPRLRMAALFLDRFDGAEAQTLYGEVLAVDARHAGALRGMARAKRFEGSSDALELAKRALETDPVSAEGHALMALLRLELGEADVAVAAADRGLATNPRSREALSVRAAARFLEGDRAEYEADRQRALQMDPRFAGFFITAAELAVRRGRYADAVALAEEAVAVDSTAWDAWALMGMNQLRTGALEAARSNLERAFAGDPFNVWTKNTLDLMDRLASFETVRSPRFELVLHRDEAALLAPYIEEVAEQAYTELAERYGHRPETPVRLEVYPRHADFSVRTMGLPGLGALGVAFGNVLAMDSPAARDPGAFHWGSTLWHEIAHAVTLGLTRHRIPRWLTEGISVREERRSRPGWGGPVSPAFLQAFHAGRLLPMSGIDAGFVRPTYPGQVGVSYQHASVVVELIEADHGADAVRRMLGAYTDGKGTEAVFRDVLGTELDAFDARFRAYVRERYAAGLEAVASLADPHGEEGAGAQDLLRAGGDLDALVRRARADRADFGAQLAAGGALFRADRHDEAEPFLERARDLYPDFALPGSPYEMLAQIRRSRGDVAGAIDALRRLTSLNESALAANIELAELLEGEGDLAGAADALERAVFIHPYEPELHDRLARLAAGLDRPELEVRERGAILALDPVDRAGSLYRLALAYRRAGDPAAARENVVAALEIAPAYADAQDLLLELSGGGVR